MRAVIIDLPGQNSVLRVAEVAPPEITPTDLRITVAAAGVNRADLLQRRGLYPPPPGASPILGLECAGTVSEVGAEVTGFAVGDRVMALLTGGGYAQEVVVPAGCVMKTPPHFSDHEAAAFPEAFLTAFLNLYVLGGLEPGRIALLHGGSGGVGTAAIALCRTAGTDLIVTAGSADRCRRCVELGATQAIDYHETDFVEAVKHATAGCGADVIVDCVGGSYLERNLRALADGGRLVVIGLMGGARAELNMAPMLRRRLTVTGSTLRSRSTDEKSETIRQLLGRFASAIADGSLRPIVHRVVPLAEAAAAHSILASGDAFGKLVLEID